jgi:peroxiredoxin
VAKEISTMVTKGDKAPDAVLRDAASTEVRLSELWREHPLVLVFLRHFG